MHNIAYAKTCKICNHDLHMQNFAEAEVPGPTCSTGSQVQSSPTEAGQVLMTNAALLQAASQSLQERKSWRSVDEIKQLC